MGRFLSGIKRSITSKSALGAIIVMVSTVIVCELIVLAIDALRPYVELLYLLFETN